MRVAALYDIHGNLPALEAVLHEVRDAGVDRVVVGGDVLPGPMPSDTIAALLDLDLPIQCIHGNGERVVLETLAGDESSPMPEQAREAVRWTASQIDDAHRRLIAGWPDTVRLAVTGLGDVLFCHATLRNDTEIVTKITPDERMAEAFGGAAATVVVCGHTHMPFDRRVGTSRVVNAGSVGMPFGASGADWLVLGTDVEFRHTAYDLAAAARRIQATAYPHAGDFAERYVLHPPSEAEMLDVFSR